VDSELIAIFEDNNPWFCDDNSRAHNKIPSNEFPVVLSGSSTELDFFIAHKSRFPYELQWLGLKMRLTKKAMK
jgi:hypothetical protein